MKYLFAFGYLVIGAASIQLRLTALGLRAVSCFADGSRSSSHSRRQSDTGKEMHVSL